MRERSWRLFQQLVSGMRKEQAQTSTQTPRVQSSRHNRLDPATHEGLAPADVRNQSPAMKAKATNRPSDVSSTMRW